MNNKAEFRVTLILVGLALAVESIFFTPGFQLMPNLVGGFMIGWNLAALFKGE